MVHRPVLRPAQGAGERPRYHRAALVRPEAKVGRRALLLTLAAAVRIRGKKDIYIYIHIDIHMMRLT